MGTRLWGSYCRTTQCLAVFVCILTTSENYWGGGGKVPPLPSYHCELNVMLGRPPLQSAHSFTSVILCNMTTCTRGFKQTGFVSWNCEFCALTVFWEIDVLRSQWSGVNDSLGPHSKGSAFDLLFVFQPEAGVWEAGQWKDGDAATLCHGEISVTFP